MSGAATTAQWLAAAGIGAGTAAAVLCVLKVALDGLSEPPDSTARSEPDPRQPSVKRSTARHAGPAALDETQPLTCVHPYRARHSKGPTWT